jgi:uncharacterized membrane protein YczE
VVKRFVFYLLGVIVTALGIVLNIRSGLGTSAVHSVSAVYSVMITRFSLGTWTIFMYFTFILIQTLIYRKFLLKVLLQIPFSLVFGVVVDVFDYFIKFNKLNIIFSSILLVSSIALVGLGVSIMIHMDFVVNPSDGIVKSIAETINMEFGKTKIRFDSSMVVFSLVSMLLIKHRISFELIGIGTIFSALFLGRFVSFFSNIFGNYYDKIYINN